MHIYMQLNNMLKSLNLSKLLTGKKLIGVGTDCTSLMTGEQNVLVIKLNCWTLLDYAI